MISLSQKFAHFVNPRIVNSRSAYNCCLALIVAFSGVIAGLHPLAVASENSNGQVVEEEPLTYTVDLADVRNHYISVHVNVPSPEKETELMMAVWTPGSYLVREYARHIDSMTVETADGESLPFEKIKKNRWLVENGDQKSFHVSYRLYCNELTVRTNWVGKQFAVLNGAPTFLTVPDRLDQEHVIRLKMPNGWTRSATSLNASGDTAHTFVAKSFDELVDSPIVAGNISVYPFNAGGIDHQLVNIGESGYWDGSKAAADLKLVVEEHHRMWGVVPYDRYLFLNVIGESGGGLEHDNSTLIMTSRWSFRDKKRYADWLSLASHEFFHTWNVRRLRPKTLVEYDYENEVYTESLWIAEGITSYYEDVALVRAGLIDQKDFLNRLTKNIESVHRSNGRKVQSLKESSFDTWIKFYRPDENSPNTRTSYYAKGAVVAFLLDAKIRSLTEGEKSLDEVMQTMFSKYAESGYLPADFRKVASEVAGEELDAWFKSAVDSTDELVFEDISALGVELAGMISKKSASDDKNTESEEAKDDGNVEGEVSDKDASDSVAKDAGESKSKKAKAKSVAKSKKPPAPKAWLGFRASESGGRMTISSVQSDSPATVAGLNTGDEVIALNDFRVTSSIDSRLRQYEIGDEVELLISRRGKLMKVLIEIGADPKRSWSLKLIAKPTDDQKAALKSWLGKPEISDE